MQSAPQRGAKDPLALCLIYHTWCPINTHTHIDTQVDNFPSIHTLQTYGKTNTRGGSQLTYILQLLYVCKKNKKPMHTHTLLHNTWAHTRTLITHNPPTQKVRRVFPWCRIKELTLPSPLFLLPLPSCTSELGNTGSWALRRARPCDRIHYVERDYLGHALQAWSHNITNTCLVFICGCMRLLPINNFR